MENNDKKENIKFSYTIFFWSTIICIVLLLGLSLIKLLEFFLNKQDNITTTIVPFIVPTKGLNVSIFVLCGFIIG